MIDAPALVQRLETAGSDLPGDLAAQVVARGDEATPLLIRLLAGHSIALEDSRRDATDPCADCGGAHDDLAWARLHAVDLLTEIGDARAIDEMLNVLENTGVEESIHDKIVERLPDFGSAALEPILRAHGRTAKEGDAAESLCCVLAALGVRDARILLALLELLQVRARAAAAYLVEYGDAAACSALLALITSGEPESEDAEARLEWLDLVEAYLALGGELPDDMKARIAAADA